MKALVPVTLDVAAANYTKWRGLFLVALSKYALTEHVLSDEHLPHRADWKQMDCVVLAWLYCTISTDLLQEVLSVDTTARLVWITLEHQFLGNCEHRAITLTADFHHFQQGDLNVADFCRKLKAMADQLGDLGEPVKDRTLVLTALNGLSEQYSHFRSLVAMQQPFPCFAALRTQLHLEELSQTPRPGARAAAFPAGSGTGSSNPKTGTPTSTHTSDFGAGNQGGGGGGGNGGGNSRNHRRRGGKGGGNQGSSNGATAPGQGSVKPPTGQPAQWPSPLNPWANTIHMWSGSMGCGVLGPRPVPAHFAGAALAGPPLGLPPQPVYGPQSYELLPGTHGFGGLGQPAQQQAQTQPSTPHALQQPMGWLGGAPT